MEGGMMSALQQLAVKSTHSYITDEERKQLHDAGYTFNTVRGPGIDRAEIYQYGRLVAVVLNGEAKWY